MKKIKGKKITAGLTSLFLVTVLVITGCIGLTGCGSSDPSQTINVFNWGEYIDEDLLRDFEDETGIKVNYTTVATCEEELAKRRRAAYLMMSSYRPIIWWPYGRRGHDPGNRLGQRSECSVYR